MHRTARLDRLPRQPALVDSRRRLHEGDGRRLREGPLVVRQRVGLLEPLRRSARLHGQRNLRRSLSQLAMKAFDSRSRSAREGASSSASTSTSRSKTAWSATTRASARRCRPSSTRSTRARRWFSPRISGRPKGQVESEVQPEAGGRAGRPSCWAARLPFAADCVGDTGASRLSSGAQVGGGVVLLENLRFHPEEEKNDPGLRSSSPRWPIST